jgi:hypothetical protein
LATAATSVQVEKGGVRRQRNMTFTFGDSSDRIGGGVRCVSRPYSLSSTQPLPRLFSLLFSFIWHLFPPCCSVLTMFLSLLLLQTPSCFLGQSTAFLRHAGRHPTHTPTFSGANFPTYILGTFSTSFRMLHRPVHPISALLTILILSGTENCFKLHSQCDLSNRFYNSALTL